MKLNKVVDWGDQRSVLLEVSNRSRISLWIISSLIFYVHDPTFFHLTCLVEDFDPASVKEAVELSV